MQHGLYEMCQSGRKCNGMELYGSRPSVKKMAPTVTVSEFFLRNICGLCQPVQIQCQPQIYCLSLVSRYCTYYSYTQNRAYRVQRWLVEESDERADQLMLSEKIQHRQIDLFSISDINKIATKHIIHNKHKNLYTEIKVFTNLMLDICQDNP